MKEYANILVRMEGRVGVVQLNRPSALNALNGELMEELIDALQTFDGAAEIGCIVITGNEKGLFAAGADIKQMVNAKAVEMMTSSLLMPGRAYAVFTSRLLPQSAVGVWVAAVNSALLCDTIVASESAKFGQPEINLGVIPGAGGTQRWTRGWQGNRHGCDPQ